jgi:hypothetical protein
VSCQQEIASDGAFSLGMIARFKKQIDIAPYFYRHLFWETGMIGQVLYLEAEAHGIRGTGIGCFYDDPVHQILGFSDNTYQSLYHFTMGGPIEALGPSRDCLGGNFRVDLARTRQWMTLAAPSRGRPAHA